ncbi:MULTISPECIES: methylated-DNA--[protein]-cysteine S-methyltransferase [Gracilibacillus]|uniref:methylated-DNA--[protein]-cysteine S-methyltransferase n=1 Tax=Gracilibacillus TaxID=74385 RepID=UPI000824367A|nr:MULTISPECIES: methylated-DNA--[protein]-cysteine S-methyltransferase [Gracilibacillus]
MNKQLIYYGNLCIDHCSVYLATTDEGVCFVGIPNHGIGEVQDWVEKKKPDSSLIEDQNKIRPYSDQLVEFIHGKRQSFNLPLDITGTPFQRAVWKELSRIPYGQVLTYTDIAEQIGNPQAVRAVGAAIGANPLMFFIPCHRVLSKKGDLTGFRGGLALKESLLALESEGKC